MTSIHAVTTGILITHHRGDDDACGDASSSPHLQSHHLPAMIGEDHKINTDLNRKNFI